MSIKPSIKLGAFTVVAIAAVTVIAIYAGSRDNRASHAADPYCPDRVTGQCRPFPADYTAI